MSEQKKRASIPRGETSQNSWKKGLKVLDDVANPYINHPDQFDNGNTSGLQYYSGDVGYHIHVACRKNIVGIDAQQLCIEVGRINANRVLHELSINKAVLYEVVKKVAEFGDGTYAAWRDFHFCNMLVLVDIGEVSKNGDKLEFSKEGLFSVRPMVWLKPLNFCPVYRANFFKSEELAFPSVNIITDWELDYFRLHDIASGLQVGETENKVVERGAEIMNGIAKNETNSLEVPKEGVNIDIDVKDMLLGLDIKIVSDRHLVKGISFQDHERINVFSAPFDFPPDVIEGMLACYHSLMSKKKEETRK